MLSRFAEAHFTGALSGLMSLCLVCLALLCFVCVSGTKHGIREGYRLGLWH
jgi:hypothetical protein